MKYVVVLVIIYIAISFLKGKKEQTHRSKTSAARKASPAVSKGENNRLLLQENKRKQLEKQYRTALQTHSKNEENIDQLYSIASGMNNVHSDVMAKVVSMCLEDIKMAPEVIRYQKEWDILYFGELSPSYSYSTFKRLAIIYEKQKHYQKAIEVCEDAIALGATNDGTEGGMQGRLVRLKKKVVKKESKTAEG